MAKPASRAEYEAVLADIEAQIRKLQAIAGGIRLIMGKE